MRYVSILLCCLISSLNLFSQTKQISGDTTYWHDHAEWLVRELDSKDLSQSKDEFNFRIQYNGCVIDIRKNKEYIDGELINYAFKQGKARETIFNKETLSDSIALEIYRLINSSGVLNLDSGSMIEGWEQGYDGITYVFECADRDNYTFKRYWSPGSQGLLKEAQVVSQFVMDVSTLLNVKERYNKFKEILPKKGCYTNGGMLMFCFQSNNYSVGYTGSTKLPLGYRMKLDMPFVGDMHANLGVKVDHSFDGRGNYDFSPSLLKKRLFIRNKLDLRDFILYTYRLRKHNDVSDGARCQNHSALYGVNFRTTTVGLGVDFLSGGKSKTGGSILIYQYLTYPKVSMSGRASVYKNQFDYKFELVKSFKVKNLSFIHIIDTSLFYENLASHGNWGWSLAILF